MDTLAMSASWGDAGGGKHCHAPKKSSVRNSQMEAQAKYNAIQKA